MSCTFGDLLQTLENHTENVRRLYAEHSRQRAEPGLRELLGIAVDEEGRMLTSLRRFHAAHRRDVLSNIWIQFPTLVETDQAEYSLAQDLRDAVTVDELRHVILTHRRGLQHRLDSAAESSASKRLDEVLHDISRLITMSCAGMSASGELD